MSRRRACRSSNQSQAPVSGLLGCCGKAASTVAAELVYGVTVQYGAHDAPTSGTQAYPACQDIPLSETSTAQRRDAKDAQPSNLMLNTRAKMLQRQSASLGFAPVPSLDSSKAAGSSSHRLLDVSALPVSSPRTRPHTAQRLGKLGGFCCWCPGWLGAPSRSTCSTAEGGCFPRPTPLLSQPRQERSLLHRARAPAPGVFRRNHALMCLPPCPWHSVLC
jgi:hypothetical protein